MIPERTMDCSEAGPLLVFLACDEVTAEERAAIENHLSGCADCRALLAEEGAFQEHALTVPQAADELDRSEEHTSELQSLAYLVCRLLLEKKEHCEQHCRSLVCAARLWACARHWSPG